MLDFSCSKNSVTIRLWLGYVAFFRFLSPREKKLWGYNVDAVAAHWIQYGARTMNHHNWKRIISFCDVYHLIICKMISLWWHCTITYASTIGICCASEIKIGCLFSVLLRTAHCRIPWSCNMLRFVLTSCNDKQKTPFLHSIHIFHAMKWANWIHSLRLPAVTSQIDTIYFKTQYIFTARIKFVLFLCAQRWCYCRCLKYVK